MRSKRGWMFLGTLVAAILVPSAVMATKQLWHTNLKDAAKNGTANGSAVLSINPANTGSMYSVIVHLPNVGSNHADDEAYLLVDGAKLPLCNNGDSSDDNDCGYDSRTGYMRFEMAITGQMLMNAGIRGAAFNAALSAGKLWCVVDFGESISSGFFIRII